MNVLQAALASLTHDDVQRRDRAAEELGDLLRAGAVDLAGAETAVTSLVAVTVNDPEPSVQESALHAVTEAFDHYQLPLRIIQPLRRLLPTMPPALIGYALYVLAATHDLDARNVIEPFLTHPDSAVRLDAAEALTDLLGPHDKNHDIHKS